jgi:hypothetical protein
MQHHTQPDPLATESFPTDPAGLPETGRPQLLAGLLANTVAASSFPRSPDGREMRAPQEPEMIVFVLYPDVTLGHRWIAASSTSKGGLPCLRSRCSSTTV